jgi:Zn-finger nucleic acid-binding protein
MACPSCLGLMFVGSRHCSQCGKKVSQAQNIAEKDLGDCPRCKIKLKLLQIGEINLCECSRCDGLWVTVETFEEVCANHEKQAEVLSSIGQNSVPGNQAKIQYVPCPDCKQLMNRNNFASSSGVIIDICKRHGVWFEPEELPRIIEFIRKGGLDHQRRKEKLQLEEQRRWLNEQQSKIARENSRFNQNDTSWDAPSTFAIRQFVRFLFD